MVFFIMGGRSLQLVNLLVGLLCMLTITGFSMRCIDKERQALLTFKKGLVDRDHLLSSWGSEEEDCCRWRGIRCDNQTGHVIVLVLRPIIHYNSPDFYEWMPLDGEISPSLLELQYLNHLDLSLNAFSRIPAFIGSLSKLTYLNLSNWDFVESIIIPHQLGNLSSLQSLDLSGNLDMSVDNLGWLSRLSSLKFLDMRSVNLSRAVDWIQSIRKLPFLSILDLSWCQLPGIIPSSLSYVNSSKSLRVLDLSGNSFNSSKFSWLFNISSTLVDLRFSYTELKGPILDSFGDLISLAHLDLSGNQLEGGIPKSFGKLCNLQTLDLSGNNLTELRLQNLTGCIEDTLEILRLSTNQLNGSLPDITRFSSLRELYLDGNQLEGSFPESIGNLSKLLVLNLGGNQLNGSLPKSIGQLSNLRILNVSSNSLNGVVSEAHLSSLSELQQLDLSFNSLTLNFSSDWVPPFQLSTIKLSSCKLGQCFPSWLQTQKNFTYLDISQSKIFDVIPDGFWNLSSKLQYLNLSFNHISGKVPNLSLKFDNFPTVDLSSNSFYGPIPPFLSNTTALNLSKNMFSGSISFICAAIENIMHYLDLSNNLLSGGLPDCWMQWNSLVILNLGNNNLSGMIPSSMGSLFHIETLHLRNNSISGKLPSSMKNCSRLNLLDLGENKFSGEIPAWIGESLTSLIVLRLRSNEFNGTIPLNICHLRSLQVLDLSLNNLSGSIPTCLNNFTAMAQKGSSALTISCGYVYWRNIGWDTDARYVDHALVMWKGIVREYSKNLRLLKAIDLSSNKLSGEIPEEVTSLLQLITLNLSRNNLTGFIPQKIGQLKSLESLDLCRNQLFGAIPQSLADLSFLGYLDLSVNNLSGRIPSSTQLQSFNASAYTGNPKLWGPPISSECPGDGTMQDAPKTDGGENIQGGEEGFGTSWSYASMGLGFTFGFWGVCGTLLLNRSWRHAYFQILSDIGDWFYVAIAVNMARLQRKLQS